MTQEWMNTGLEYQATINHLNFLEEKYGIEIKKLPPVKPIPQDENAYDETFGTTHSDCYTVWGMSRTGCVGCPYNRKIGDEIEIMRYYEPKKAKAAEYIFRDSYEYTRQYREFAAKMNTKEKQVKGQISIFDFKELTNDTERG